MNTEVARDERIHKARAVRTVARFKRKWMENVTANAGAIQKTISDLWLDKGYGEAISIAAGPSLAEDVERIKSMREGREVGVVDAGLKFCLDHGLVPDYVISTDASAKILTMFQDVGPLPNTKLVLNVIAHPDVAKAWKGEIYWFVMANQFYDLDNREMIQTMHAVTSRVGAKLAPGGNVSSIALGFFLSVRNVDKLHLFGHDFCWKDSMYAGGGMKDLEAERMRDESQAGTVFKRMNNRGEQVWTNLSLDRYAKWHEETIAHMKNRVTNHTSSTILTV